MKQVYSIPVWGSRPAQSESGDLDGVIVNHTWDFGDKDVSYNRNTSHCYSLPGVYTVRYTVTDDDGSINTTSFQITVHSPEDFDFDSIPDIWESEYGLDPYNATDADIDIDGDNLSNLEEYENGTNPLLWDSDGDGYSDGMEIGLGTDPLDNTSYPSDFDDDGVPDVMDSDDDNDGVSDTMDAFPFNNTEWNDTDKDGIGDNADIDDDNDGYNDTVELQCGTNPYNNTSYPSDLDNDGIPDALDSDIDGDGVPNDEDDFPYDSTRWKQERSKGSGQWYQYIIAAVIVVVIFITVLFYIRKRGWKFGRDKNKE